MNYSTHNNKTNGSNIHDSFMNDNENGAENLVFAVAYLIVLLVAVMGNSFVIHVARKLLSAGRGPFNILVINMAASDILYALTIVPLQVKYPYVGLMWIPGKFGTFLCKINNFALLLAIDSSIFTLTAMNIDRYLAIVPTIKKPLTRRNVLKVVAGILGFSCLYSSIQLFKYNTVPKAYRNTTKTRCIPVYSHDKDLADKLYTAEKLAWFILVYLFPVIITTTLYVSIIRFLSLRKIPGNRTDQNERRRREQLRKVTLMLVSMAITFAITWFPVHVINYYYVFDNVLTLSSFVVALMFWTAHTNCATNPCFYLIFNKEYRDELRRIIQRCRCTENRAQDINLQ